MKAIRKIADKHKLLVIEDNAQGIGAHGDGFKIGAVERRHRHQFHHPEEPGHLRRRRRDGHQQFRASTPPSASCATTAPTPATSTAYGFNSRLDDIHAAILSAKLKHIDAWNDLRRKRAARYTAGLKGAKHLTLPYEAPGYRHVFHLYVIETKDAGQAGRVLEISQRRRRSTPRPITPSPSTSRPAIRGASRRASPVRWPTPSTTPPPASPCRCSPN